MTSVKEFSTFRSFWELMADMRPSPPTPPDVVPSAPVVPCLVLETRVKVPQAAGLSLCSDSSDRKGLSEDASTGTFRFKQTIIGGCLYSLLGAIYSTLDIKEEQVALSRHDLMYDGLEEPKGRVFPVHKLLSDYP